jgi:hypothetical protein
VALVAVFGVATFVGPTADASINDFGLYRLYARAVLHGGVPYRDFALEYPPGALVPMVAPGVVAGTTGFAYKALFSALMCACLLVVQHEAARLLPGRERAVEWALVLLPVAAGAIVRMRFDLFAVALAVAGLRRLLDGARTGRAPDAGFLLLGLGAATKLFPAVLAAAGVAWLWGRGRRANALRGAAIAAGVFVVVCAPFVIASPGGFVAQARFHAERPLQIESVPATILRLASDPAVTGAGTSNPDEFRSQGVEGPGVGVLATLFTALQIAGIAAALRWAYTAGRRDDVQTLLLAAAAALLAFLALGKVLSPQYLLWIAPLAPALWVAGARASAALIAAALVLTQLEFPARYAALVRGDAAALTLLSARDAALLAALALLPVAARRTPGRTAAAAAGT